MKNSNHASKALAVVLSGALAFAPAANAALDESNMAYTSAAEGFYGSLRVQYANNDNDGGKSNDSTVEADSSRLGVRGDVDLGGGLEAFYGFEWNLGDPADADTGLKTRQNHVGLKGDWGSIFLGAFDSVIVRFGGFATTDITDQYGGNFEPIYRTKNAIAYVSPDLNGFQFGVEAAASNGDSNVLDTVSPGGTVTFTGSDGEPVGCGVSTVPAGSVGVTSLNEAGTGCTLPGGNAKVVSSEDDGNDFDKIGFGASYSIQGLTFSGAYYQEQDALGKGLRYDIGDDKFAYESLDDNSRYALGISYSQDNWVVAAMYGGQDFSSPFSCVDTPTEVPTNNTDVCDYEVSKIGDATFFSVAAGVSIDKLDIHGLWEQKTEESYWQFDGNDGTNAAPTPTVGGLVSRDRDTTIAAVTARYHLGSKTNLRAAWKNTEVDAVSGSTINGQDSTQYALGLRVDF